MNDNSMQLLGRHLDILIADKLGYTTTIITSRNATIDEGAWFLLLDPDRRPLPPKGDTRTYAEIDGKRYPIEGLGDNEDAAWEAGAPHFSSDANDMLTLFEGLKGGYEVSWSVSDSNDIEVVLSIGKGAYRGGPNPQYETKGPDVIVAACRAWLLWQNSQEPSDPNTSP